MNLWRTLALGEELSLSLTLSCGQVCEREKERGRKAEINILCIIQQQGFSMEAIRCTPKVC